MAPLSLHEAAEQTGTSKVDIWRAIQAGSLPAHRTDDGGFAIDPTELFRVFESQRPEQRRASQDGMEAPEALGPPEAAETPATAAPDNDMAVAFAALQAELKGLLGLPAKVQPNADLGRNREEGEAADLPRRTAQLAAAEPAAEPARAETATTENAAQAEPRRSWWRRGMSRING